MRVCLVLALFALPAVAAAEPTLTCGFEDNKTKVVVVNDSDKNKQCNYACHYRIEGGSASISGSTGVKAGETKTVDEDTHRGKVAGVREQSLKCE